ncbi:MAG: NusG domain II-containing protein, partial [bacterium]
SLLFLLAMFFLRRGGTQVVVYREGKRTESFSLSEDRVFEIVSANGTNLLTVKDGEAYLANADCPDLLCVHMGKIRYDGQTIVCLPHKIVVAIEDGKKERLPESGGEVDIVAR